MAPSSLPAQSRSAGALPAFGKAKVYRRSSSLKKTTEMTLNAEDLAAIATESHQERSGAIPPDKNSAYLSGRRHQSGNHHHTHAMRQSWESTVKSQTMKIAALADIKAHSSIVTQPKKHGWVNSGPVIPAAAFLQCRKALTGRKAHRFSAGRRHR